MFDRGWSREPGRVVSEVRAVTPDAAHMAKIKRARSTRQRTADPRGPFGSRPFRSDQKPVPVAVVVTSARLLDATATAAKTVAAPIHNQGPKRQRSERSSSALPREMPPYLNTRVRKVAATVAPS